MMKLLRWIPAAAVAGALAVTTPAAADAQSCSGSRFATCATVVVAPVALGVALLAIQDPRPNNPQDLLAFSAPDQGSVSANDGCPSPNGANGAATVATQNPHCNGSADVGATVTPEPASMVLLGTALLTLGAGIRSRRKTV